MRHNSAHPSPKHAPTWQRKGTSLLLAFGLATTAAPSAQATSPLQKETHWKTNIVDAVIALRPCPQTTICGEIVWHNPADAKAQEYFGNPATAEADNLCGFSPRMQFERVAENHWRGTMDMRGRGITVHMDAQLLNDTTLEITASKFIFTERDTWKRIEKNDPRYPRCSP